MFLISRAFPLLILLRVDRGLLLLLSQAHPASMEFSFRVLLTAAVPLTLAQL